MSLIGDIYYGVPKYCGELFRATKAPTILILFFLFGLPLLAAIGITTYAVVNHSTSPLKIVIAAAIQPSIALDPTGGGHLSPDQITLLKELTPAQKARATQAMNAMFLDSWVIIGCLIWWGIRFRKFRARRKLSVSLPEANTKKDG